MLRFHALGSRVTVRNRRKDRHRGYERAASEKSSESEDDQFPRLAYLGTEMMAGLTSKYHGVSSKIYHAGFHMKKTKVQQYPRMKE